MSWEREKEVYDGRFSFLLPALWWPTKIRWHRKKFRKGGGVIFKKKKLGSERFGKLKKTCSRFIFFFLRDRVDQKWKQHKKGGGDRMLHSFFIFFFSWKYSKEQKKCALFGHFRQKININEEGRRHHSRSPTIRDTNRQIKQWKEKGLSTVILPLSASSFFAWINQLVCITFPLHLSWW